MAKINDLLREILRPLEATACSRRAMQELVSFNEARQKNEFVGQIITLRNVSDYKKLDQVKSNFLATVSHGLPPLSSISLNAKLLQDERLLADERLRVTGHIRQETQRLQRIVNELLDVSRLDAGAVIQPDLHPTNLADVVRFATATVQPQLTDKQIGLDLTAARRVASGARRHGENYLYSSTCWPMPSATRPAASRSRCAPLWPAPLCRTMAPASRQKTTTRFFSASPKYLMNRATAAAQA